MTHLLRVILEGEIYVGISLLVSFNLRKGRVDFYYIHVNNDVYYESSICLCFPIFVSALLICLFQYIQTSQQLIDFIVYVFVVVLNVLNVQDNTESSFPLVEFSEVPCSYH